MAKTKAKRAKTESELSEARRRAEAEPVEKLTIAQMKEVVVAYHHHARSEKKVLKDASSRMGLLEQTTAVYEDLVSSLRDSGGVPWPARGPSGQWR